MRTGIIAALGLAFTVPAFADKADRVKDDAERTTKNVGDELKDASDKTQDKLGTDSGVHKAKRHANRGKRHVKKEMRNKSHDAKKQLDLGK